MSRYVNVSTEELASFPVTHCPSRRARGIPVAMSVQTRYKMHAKRRTSIAPSRAISAAPAIIAKPSLRKPIPTIASIYRDFALRYDIPFIPVRLRYDHDLIDVVCVPLVPVLSHLALL